MTPTQRELARHALGLSDRHRKSYRNHFVTGEGSTDYPHWMAMVEAGYARRLAGSLLTGGDDLFKLTPSGAVAALDDGDSLCPEDFPAELSTPR